ncbi:MAG: prepilin-type N-terminal cleavage/methylation domain-containing protein [Zwartia sp.]|nr:prepilin-type N-terminal cleavage/methylation domain-containing protein [Zwartia sp.]MDO9025465.1 prepilin-type N-terminal cleavage/methylation domain-containing protein [Zwartia sp.]
MLLSTTLLHTNQSYKSLARQRGFSLIEISIVTTIMMLLAIVGIPAIQGYIVESKVPRVAEEIQRFVARLKMTTHGFGASPYGSVDTTVLANSLRGSSVVAVTGTGSGANVAHGLGGAGVSGRGVIRVVPHALSGAPVGSAFLLTLNDVNHAACPGLASVLQRIAEVVTISGAGGPVMVKNNLNEPASPYNPLLADAQCLTGDRNVFEFVIR